MSGLDGAEAQKTNCRIPGLSLLGSHPTDPAACNGLERPKQCTLHLQPQHSCVVVHLDVGMSVHMRGEQRCSGQQTMRYCNVGK